MDRPPTMIVSAVLDIGWIGYAIFCITNIISAMAVSLPSLPGNADRRQQFLNGTSMVLHKWIFGCLAPALCLSYILIGSIGSFKKMFSYNLSVEGPFQLSTNSRVVA